jgi:SAM-dependent methyltransferase
MSWFANWFDSTYYHLLYDHRNEAEAAAFINTLVAELKPKAGSRILDLGCGKGRHAQQLAQKGFDVIGLDLSEQSILSARAMETEHLHFFTQDMRRPYTINYFDYVFSFFTSFGYFETEREDQAVFDSVAKNLKQDGVFVLDFMNAQKVIRTLLPTGEKTAHDFKTKQNVHFTWEKRVENGFIYKKIHFKTATQHHEFEERVRAFSLDDITRLAANANLKLLQVFGNYQLDLYDTTDSDRMICVFCKIK